VYGDHFAQEDLAEIGRGRSSISFGRVTA